MDLSILALLRERAEPGCPEALLYEGLPSTAGIRPSGDDSVVVDGDPIEAWLRSRPDRRATGLYLTRPAAARGLLRIAAADGFRPRRILDPAVGAGVFLEEAWRLFGPDAELHGIDIDPVAVVLTRLALWRQGVSRDAGVLAGRIRWGDALGDPAMDAAGGFDLVCGNPPFGNAIEKRTGRGVADQRELRERFPETASGPYDRSVLFVHLAARCLAPGGRCALLIPRALLSARYATRLRGLLRREAPPRWLVLYEESRPAHDCSISMVGLIGGLQPESTAVEVVGEGGEAVRTVPQARLTDSTWGVLVDREGGACGANLGEHSTFGELFEVRASMTVAEAYRVRDVLREKGEGWRFLTSGLITPHGDQWGSVRARHLARTYDRPVLPKGTGCISAARESLLDRSKVIVAGLSRTLEARLDLEGRYAGSVGTMMLFAKDGSPVAEGLLLRATLLLNSAWLSAIHRARRGPQALSGGSIPLGRRDIEEFPFPSLLSGRTKPHGSLAARLDVLDRRARAASRASGGVDVHELREDMDALLAEILGAGAPPGDPAKCVLPTSTSSGAVDHPMGVEDDD